MPSGAKKGGARRPADAVSLALPAAPPVLSSLPDHLDSPAASVPLAIRSPAGSRPASIGQIETALSGAGRAQHRITRIEVTNDMAVAHVHPDDVANCVGTLTQGNIQVCVVEELEPSLATLAAACLAPVHFASLVSLSSRSLVSHGALALSSSSLSLAPLARVLG